MADTDLKGTVLDGRYQVIEPIAEGAMGSVWRGERVKLGRAVAIKIMHQELPDELASRQRFEREAKLMALLEHPNCVSVIDFGLHEDKPFLVMDLVRGTSLIEILDKEGHLDVARSSDIIRQVLSGLAHAHERGIVHRDIKPANIMISDKPGLGVQVRILDFGLARLQEATGTKLTTGIVVGTPNYMAPEQCKGGDIDARTDLYACGVMLFEMLTGRKPFIADDPIQVVRKHLMEKAPTLASITPNVDYGELEDVIAKALAKAPNDRFASAIDMAKAIEAAAGKATKMSAAALFSRAVPESAPGAGNQQATMSGWSVPQDPSAPPQGYPPPPHGYPPPSQGYPPPPQGYPPPSAQEAMPPPPAPPVVAPPPPVAAPPPPARTATPAAGAPAAPRPATPAAGARAVPPPRMATPVAGAPVAPPTPRIPTPVAGAPVAPPDGPHGATMHIELSDSAVLPESNVMPLSDSAIIPSSESSLPPLPKAAPYVPPPAFAPSSGAPDESMGVPPTRPTGVPATKDRPIPQLPLTKKQLMIGGGGLAALIVIIIAVVASGGSKSSSAKPKPGSGTVVDNEPKSDPVPQVVERANGLIASEDFEEAVAVLKRARKANPDNAQLAFLSGKANFGRLWWSDGIDDFREAIKLDDGYKENQELLKTVLKGFLTTPDVDDRIVDFMREVGPPFRPLLEETAEKHPKKALRARARAELNAKP